MIENLKQWLRARSRKFTRKYFAENLAVLFVFSVVMFLLSGLVLSLENKGIDSTEAAGWTQAIGTVLAVVAAYIIAANQSKATLKSIADAHNLAEQSKRNGALAVVRAAKLHASNIGEAISDESCMKIYDVYDKTIITSVVGALSAAPIYELGFPTAVSGLLSLRDQFVFLGNQVETYLAGPWKHEVLGPMLEDLRSPEYVSQLEKTLKSSKLQLANNVKQRVNYILEQCNVIEHALSSR